MVTQCWREIVVQALIRCLTFNAWSHIYEKENVNQDKLAVSDAHGPRTSSGRRSKNCKMMDENKIVVKQITSFFDVSKNGKIKINVNLGISGSFSL